MCVPVWSMYRQVGYAGEQSSVALASAQTELT